MNVPIFSPFKLVLIAGSEIETKNFSDPGLAVSGFEKPSPRGRKPVGGRPNLRICSSVSGVKGLMSGSAQSTLKLGHYASAFDGHVLSTGAYKSPLLVARRDFE